ncbi:MULTISPECIES: hypothetical protein [unclassified Acidisoma]|jgi:hypothetical protein|uniref:hypothetical protein n=1 Tax=unclassified Acidisoma TaxID=2634065 RepID=UPI00131E1E46|nr:MULTISPECIES: hypothetical protein [unclassified Acidisoma]
MLGKMVTGKQPVSEGATVLPFVRPDGVAFRQMPELETFEDHEPFDEIAFADAMTWSVGQDFGRSGLQLDGMHRDQQGFGAWGLC